MQEPAPEDLQRFFKTAKWRFEKCLEPHMACPRKAIRAHSIQNARVFNLLSDKNHVLMFGLHFSKERPKVQLKKIGRNEASTFPGFCAEHDAEIFRALDTKPLDLTDLEQLFLLAYRSVSRELHATMEAAAKIQSAYLGRVERGWDKADEPSDAGVFAVHKMAIAWETWKYRYRTFDNALLSRSFEGIQHDIVQLPVPPSVAASCLFSIDEVPFEDGVLRVSLNILPVSVFHSVAVFSYTKGEAPLARLALSRVLEASGTAQMYELSKLVVERMENFALNPAHVARWSKEKLETIKTEFTATMLMNGIKDDANLMLF